MLFVIIEATGGQIFATLVLLPRVLSLVSSEGPYLACTDNKCYIVYDDVPVNQNTAANECKKRTSGSLVSVADKAKQDILNQLLKSTWINQKYWIGAQLHELSEWQWLDSTPSTNNPEGIPWFFGKTVVCTKIFTNLKTASHLQKWQR